MSETYGRLTLLEEFVNKAVDGSYKGLWCCECGTEKLIVNYMVRNGRTKSCGCITKENNIKRSTHGHRQGRLASKTYISWRNMNSRCYYEPNNRHHLYGGRGIEVCDRWRHSFDNFLADMGERPKNTTLDRIDSNGNYEPTNCRWASNKTQARNKSNNTILELDGVTKTAPEWGDNFGISPIAIRARLSRGWSTEEAIRTPLGGKRGDYVGQS
jgi:hypothetical protein